MSMTNEELEQAINKLEALHVELANVVDEAIDLITSRAAKCEECVKQLQDLITRT